MIDYTSLPAKEIERLARMIPPGGWGIERQRPLATLLGSCVAVCMYDLQAGVAGMNHFMLPSMSSRKFGDTDALLAGDYAMEALRTGLLKQGARKERLQAKAFGGGTIIDSSLPGALSIGMKNANFAREWLEREGIPLVASDLLGAWSRKVLLVPGNGDAWSRRMLVTMAVSQQVKQEEARYAKSLTQPQGKTPTPATCGDGPKIELF
jgi:chemotaxis protein CheD